MSRLPDAVAQLSESTWALAATLGSPAGGSLRDALAALRSVLWGGPLAPDVAGAGFADVRVQLRTPAGLTPLVARRP